MIRRSINPKRLSITPKRAKSGENVDELYKNLGRPDPELVSALLEGLDEPDLMEQTAVEAPATPHLLHDATAIIFQAYTAWQRLSGEKRANKLRGCTLPLFAIAVEHVRKLQQLYNEHLKRVAEQEAASKRYQELLAEGRTLVALGRAVLIKVAGNRPGTASALEQGIGDPTNSQELLRGLRYLSETSRNLLALPASSVRSRAVLFGLNKSFVDSVDVMLEQIRHAEQKMNQRLSQMPSEQTMERVRAIVWFLLKHLSEMFRMAHEADSTIPELRPLHQASAPPLVRQKLPGASASLTHERVIVVAPTKPVIIERVRIPPFRP